MAESREENRTEALKRAGLAPIVLQAKEGQTVLEVARQAGIELGPRGAIAVDEHMRTNVPNIFAIGDVAGPPMLAHKASHEGVIAAERAAGADRAGDERLVVGVAHHDRDREEADDGFFHQPEAKLAVARTSLPGVFAGGDIVTVMVSISAAERC